MSEWEHLPSDWPSPQAKGYNNCPKIEKIEVIYFIVNEVFLFKVYSTLIMNKEKERKVLSFFF